ncbi:[Acyl-carrier-protein] S-malonyltransferase [Pelagirhabdus alkalitolerans]|uniref:Malonyl CoA-acyl carrier protein transacylase n=1 Tax=Pelagirhabdus alkalitolerans TaxID=1612202 RepID=A0A1G6H236_9BACI|nr:ACP S-malonyltransferase [Pelagirhabdus alkalitolerans]SDB88261.1 [Acyl-carrier-protein] S-malonyltransferase [Pelagirhabdus alkalitolerans]
MKKVAFIFPGQGSQKVGMHEAFLTLDSSLHQIFDDADQALGFSLSELMVNGPEETLTETKYAQPALLLTSVMIDQELKKRGVTPSVVAGHSLGEYSALVSSGVLSVEEATKLVHKRGQLMEEAYPKGQGKMAAVLGLSRQEIEDVLTTLDETVEVANLNCPGQIVISGTTIGIEKSVDLLKEKGAKRVLPLNVSGPFHSSLMKTAALDFSRLLDDIEFSDAQIPVYANVTANKVEKNDQIKQLLVEQLYSPVLFEEIVRKLLAEDLDAIVEVGSGKVLTGLVKKIDRRFKTFSIQDPESLEAFIEWYKGGDD